MMVHGLMLCDVPAGTRRGDEARHFVISVAMRSALPYDSKVTNWPTRSLPRLMMLPYTPA